MNKDPTGMRGRGLRNDAFFLSNAPAVTKPLSGCEFLVMPLKKNKVAKLQIWVDRWNDLISTTILNTKFSRRPSVVDS